MFRLWCSTLIISVLLPVRLFAEPITYFQTDLRYSYRIELLQLALQKSGAPFELKPHREKVNQARGEALLERGEISVAFLPTTPEREQRFRAVRYPIMQGILGYRIFLIRKDAQPRFSAVSDIDQIRHGMVAGFGAHWADLAILRANGFRTEEVVLYESLFKMLCAGYFDYFPRGLNEAWRELEIYGDVCPQLHVEETLALYYPYPVYFFVHKDNQALAQRIKHGLQLAQADGSFRELFMRHHSEIIRRTNIPGRRLFKLRNPNLLGPEPDTGWWLPADVAWTSQRSDGVMPKALPPAAR